jgi:hypothetical protein
MPMQPLPSPSSDQPVLHALAWILGAAALLAIAIGAWMVMAAEDATLAMVDGSAAGRARG